MSGNAHVLCTNGRAKDLMKCYIIRNEIYAWKTMMAMVDDVA